MIAARAMLSKAAPLLAVAGLLAIWQVASLILNTDSFPSALDGIPKHLPALLRVEKLVKKARKAKLLAGPKPARPAASQRPSRSTCRARDAAPSCCSIRATRNTSSTSSA